MSTLNTLLIGSGRLARHLHHWSKLNQPLHHSISLMSSAESVKSQSLMTWNRSQPIELLQDYLKTADIVWLAISDQAIVPFFETQLQETKARVVHFSGALYDSRLSGLHPLMSFPEKLLDNETYGKIHFAVDENISDLDHFLPGFDNSFFKIPAQQKALYHALCVSSGNFPQILWTICMKEFRKLNVPDAAVEIYIQQIAASFNHLKEKSLTGPLVRGDQTTIAKNLLAFESIPSLHSIYQTFAGAYKNEN